MFVHCVWPPRDQIDVRYIYFRDSVTIDFIRWLASLTIKIKIIIASIHKPHASSACDVNGNSVRHFVYIYISCSI